MKYTYIRYIKQIKLPVSIGFVAPNNLGTTKVVNADIKNDKALVPKEYKKGAYLFIIYYSLLLYYFYIIY